MKKPKDAVSIDQAVQKVKEWAPLAQTETVSVLDACGRILAQDVLAQIQQPPFNRSAMDGYALCHEDLQNASAQHPVVLTVVGEQLAGQPPFRPLKRGEALRIMTGAVIPQGADCVLPQEKTDYGMDKVQCFEPVCQWQNFCSAGEDFEQGETLAKAGQKVDAYLMAAAAAAGVSEFSVRKKVKAALITTGDELTEPGKPLTCGKIYNSNLALFSARLQQLGCEVILCESAGDDIQAIEAALMQAVHSCDLIVTTGGVSVGVKDLIPEVMKKLQADIVFHGISIKPGMPTMFSVVDGVPVLSLSGNPFSASAVFELLVQPLLKQMTGSSKTVLRSVPAQAQNSFSGNIFSTRILRGYFEDQKVWFDPAQKNGRTITGIGSNCLIRIEKESGSIQKGDQVQVMLL